VTTLVILQPGYLPWLGYFDQMRLADVFVHYDDVPFDKHGWRNRNRIKGPQGAVWLTVPVRHRGRAGQLINEVEIDERQDWRRKHLSAVTQYYARAPFAGAVLPALCDLLRREWPGLAALNLAVIDWLAGQLSISTPCYRASILGIGGDRNDRLIGLCRHFGARRYLSGNAAGAYIDVAQFAAAGIEIAWHDYVHPVYPQLHGAFIPYLSVLDLVLSRGPDSLSVLSGASSPAR
jgi:hypothetical protein